LIYRLYKKVGKPRGIGGDPNKKMAGNFLTAPFFSYGGAVAARKSQTARTLGGRNSTSKGEASLRSPTTSWTPAKKSTSGANMNTSMKSKKKVAKKNQGDDQPPGSINVFSLWPRSRWGKRGPLINLNKKLIGT